MLVLLGLHLSQELQRVWTLILGEPATDSVLLVHPALERVSESIPRTHAPFLISLIRWEGRGFTIAVLLRVQFPLEHPTAETCAHVPGADWGGLQHCSH